MLALHNDPRFDVLAVYTQQDKPVGRKALLTPTKIGALAEELQLPVHKPASVRSEEVIAQIKAMEPDFIVVVAYGKIIPKAILDIPTHGVINIHASILPRHRGAAPIQAALLHGDSITGVAIMLMSEGLDEGDILHIETTNIDKLETAGTLFDKLSHLGARVLPDVLDQFAKGNISPVPQDHTKATHQGKIAKDMGEIHVSKMTATEIYHTWQGLTPWPGIYLFDAYGKRIKLLQLVPVSDVRQHLKTGETRMEGDILYMGAKEGAIGIQILQKEGKRPMTAKEFMQGGEVVLG